MSAALETRRAVAIALEVEGPREECEAFAGGLYDQLSSGAYDQCSVLALEGSVADWEASHRTARKRAWRAERLGYRVEPIARERYADDVWAINTSLAARQGRPMASAYLERPSFGGVDSWGCRRHLIAPYGVLTGSRLVAYAWIYRAGDLALVSSVLGHGEALEDGVMFLLVRGVLEGELEAGGFLVYNRHDSGGPGLRWFKERAGFEAREVRWLP